MTEGVLAWFARHRVAANLMSVLIVASGAIALGFGIKQEVFPEFSLDLISIRVPYLGAAPQEVEEGVVQRIEEAIQGLDGVEEIVSTASEGVGSVNVKLTLGADGRRVLDDIKSRIDAIETFPEETEEPIVSEVTNRRQVIDIAIYGDADEKTLRVLAERVRDDLTAIDGITVVELANARPYEVSIEIAESDLRRYGLTLDEVARQVRASSLDLPGGSIETGAGEVLLRTKGQAYTRLEFEALPLRTRTDGTELRLGDVATVIDGFEETDQESRFDGKPAILLNVFRVGNEDALGIASKVLDYLERESVQLPAGVSMTHWQNSAQVLQDRRDLLLKNGTTGLVLVFLLLTLFLRPRLAFWTGIGLLIAFMGTIWLMPTLDVSINLISLFAFILVLGIVVDDAIVVAENIYTEQKRTGRGMQGAIDGVRGVSRPVVFAVLTTVAAFTPLLSIEGSTGKVMRVIPLIVIPCLLWSLFESLLILPAHLSHYTKRDRRNPFARFQTFFSDGLEKFVRRFYSPVLEVALRWRYATLALGLTTLLLTLGVYQGGFLRFIFFPTVEADFITATVTMPPGSPVDETRRAVLRLERAAEELRREVEAETGRDVFRHMSSSIGEQPFARSQSQNAGGFTARDVRSNLGELTIELQPAETRDVGGEQLVQRWRERTGRISDAVETGFSASLFTPGDDIDVQLTGPDLDRLIAASDAIQERLAGYAGVYEIGDSFLEGKREIKLDIRPEAELLGLTLADLGSQVRQAFYGEEAQRIQRGRDDVRVMVRYPERERESLESLEDMRIRTRTPDGEIVEVPFSEVATASVGRGFSTIRRVDRRRAVNVTADVDPAQATPEAIIEDLRANVLPEVLRDFPRVSYTFEGQQAEQRDTLNGLRRGFLIALIAIYGLLAIPLRSYVQPIVIMLAIPFGLVGAMWGHLLMGMDLTILSMFGLVALTGVVVNDSLVMVDFINTHREEKDGLLAAVRAAGVARFRPILLTSLTTFAGLSPLMLERSMQARFLIPMAVSLGFGVVFSTFITLMLVPAGYMAMVDVQRRLRGLFGMPAEPDEGVSRASGSPGSP